MTDANARLLLGLALEDMLDLSAAFRQDLPQIVEEVRDEHDVVLYETALVRRRGEGQALTIGMNIEKGIRKSTAG